MSLKKKDSEQPRREKENMDEPQEEFIDASAVPSHTKQEGSEGAKTKKAGETGESRS
jgi:hypothetical protein